MVAKFQKGRGKIEEIEIPKTIDRLEVDGSYQELLANHLRQALRLPEYGEVKIKLTLDRSGKVKNVEILSAKSKVNSAYVQKSIPSLTFPCFETYLKGKKQTFTIVLQND